METRGYEQRSSRRAPARRRSTGRPGIVVLLMTVATLAVVGVLAAQANGSPTPQAAPTATSTATTHGKSTTTATADPNALPANSGTGMRVVYSIGGKRVWLVSSSNAVQSTFAMVPGTIQPPTGTFTVTGRDQTHTGGDNVQVVYVVFFDGSYGFDAEARVSGMPAPPTGATKGARTSQDNALLIWNFAPLGTTVVVVA